MRKNMLFVMLLSSVLVAHAQDSLSIQEPATGNAGKQTSGNNIKYVHFSKLMYRAKHSSQDTAIAPKPEITISQYPTNELASNWFISTAGGVSAFLGNPLGCADLFGRLRPVFHLSIGKWFSPTVGGRIAFQGFDLKNHLIERQNYYHLHADFLWNVTNLFRQDKPETRWNFIPFAGTGIIHNNASHQHPFAFNYGLLNQFRVTNRLSLSLELGGLTTFDNFSGADGGKGNKFSSHLFHLSAGVSITLGNKGWSCRTNRINSLLTLNNNLSEANKQLQTENRQNSLIMAQMTKILQIEGLLSHIQGILEKSGLALSGDTVSMSNFAYYPTNNYSGLNSLRKRLSTAAQKTDDHTTDDSCGLKHLLSADKKDQSSEMDIDILAMAQDSLFNIPIDSARQNYRNYLSNVINRKVCIGSPILFFFHIGTTTLTDSSQLTNIDEIVKIGKKYDLMLHVTGYADSATGNAAANSALSTQRANYIASQLEKRGISPQSVKFVGKGGIHTYSPDKVNRCAKIEIYLKP